MKRWIRRIVLCVFLGAIINVAVAWGCVGAAHRISYGSKGLDPFVDFVFADVDFGSIDSLREVDQVWIRDQEFEPPRWQQGGTEWQVERNEWIGFRESSFARVPAGMTGRYVYSRFDGYRSRAGWPLLTMRSERSYPSPYQSRSRLSGVIELSNSFTLGPLGEFSPFDLPFQPIWPGFLANTALYAVTAWALFFLTPAQIRRQLRRHRGRCPSCGYDLQGDSGAGCPECGWGREEGAES